MKIFEKKHLWFFGFLVIFYIYMDKSIVWIEPNYYQNFSDTEESIDCEIYIDEDLIYQGQLKENLICGVREPLFWRMYDQGEHTIKVRSKMLGIDQQKQISFGFLNTLNITFHNESYLLDDSDTIPPYETEIRRSVGLHLGNSLPLNYY